MCGDHAVCQNHLCNDPFHYLIIHSFISILHAGEKVHQLFSSFEEINIKLIKKQQIHLICNANDTLPKMERAIYSFKSANPDKCINTCVDF